MEIPFAWSVIQSIELKVFQKNLNKVFSLRHFVKHLETIINGFRTNYTMQLQDSSKGYTELIWSFIMWIRSNDSESRSKSSCGCFYELFSIFTILHRNLGDKCYQRENLMERVVGSTMEIVSDSHESLKMEGKANVVTSFGETLYHVWKMGLMW